MIEDSQVGKGTEPGRRPLSLVLYQTGLLLLGVILLGIASETAIAPEFRRALPLLYTVMLLWCAVQIGTLWIPFTSAANDFNLRIRIAVDLVFSLAIVWLTGGVVSFFLPILFASVLATSTLLGLRRALFLASTATLALLVMTTSQILGWRPAEWSGALQLGTENRTGFLLSSLIGQGLALHVIAFLGARLMGGLERAERLNELIVESIGDGIIALDERGRLLLMNHETSNLLGHSLDVEWRGKHPEAVFQRSEDSELLDVLDNPVPGLRRMEWLASRDRRVPLSVNCTRCASNLGRGWIWIFRLHDLTLEQRAARAEERLRNLKVLEDLALGLVHEIRNPLASIRGCVQELGGGKLAGDQAERLTRIVLRESDRLDRIVNEFMECASTSPTRTEPILLTSLIEEITESLSERPDAEGVGIVVTGRSDAVVEGHRELLYRVLFNLGVNAVEASEEGGEVEFAVERGDPDGWCVEVSDRGCGMDEATRRRIFNPFFTTKTREGGLGLALVERIVHGHGGAIDVESRPDEGSRFRLWLPDPIANGEVEPNEATDAPSPAAATFGIAQSC